jgi:hypothetical protein
MKKYSQKELLKEGFWQGVGTFAKRATDVAKYAAKTALPATTKAVTDTKKTFGNVKTLVTGGQLADDERYKTMTPQLKQSIEAGMAKMGKPSSGRTPKHHTYDNMNKIHTYEAYYKDPTDFTEKTIYVNSSGNEVQAPYKDKSKEVTTEIVKSIKDGLLRQNIRLSFRPITYQSYDPERKKHIYKATVFNSAGGEVGYYVDKDGVILNPQTSTTPAPTPPTNPPPTP